jgi:hypothetical protein
VVEVILPNEWANSTSRRRWSPNLLGMSHPPTAPRSALRQPLYRLLAVLLGIAMLVGLGVLSDPRPAAAASFCLNGSRQFVPCYQLPAGSGTQQTVPPPEQHLQSPARPPQTRPQSHPPSQLHAGAAEIAAGVVVVGLVVGAVSLAVGVRRRQKVSRWDDSRDYRAV